MQWFYIFGIGLSAIGFQWFIRMQGPLDHTNTKRHSQRISDWRDNYCASWIFCISLVDANCWIVRSSNFHWIDSWSFTACGVSADGNRNRAHNKPRCFACHLAAGYPEIELNRGKYVYAKETLKKWLRGRIAALRGARFLAYLFGMSWSLRAGRLALHPARSLLQCFLSTQKP